MNIRTLNFGYELSNAYVVGDEGKPCFVIDFPSSTIETFCLRHHPFIAGIFLTHGHYDHIAGLNGLSDTFSAPIIMHPGDEDFLTDPRLNGSQSLFGKTFVLEKQNLNFYRCEDEDEILPDRQKAVSEAGEEIVVGGTRVLVMHTPYHTNGSCCFYLPEEKVLFSGDSLFRYGVGRTDLAGGSPRLFQSSMRKILALPDETKVYCGHGPSTTIGTEKRGNPDIQGII